MTVAVAALDLSSMFSFGNKEPEVDPLQKSVQDLQYMAGLKPVSQGIGSEFEHKAARADLDEVMMQLRSNMTGKNMPASTVQNLLDALVGAYAAEASRQSTERIMSKSQFGAMHQTHRLYLTMARSLLVEGAHPKGNLFPARPGNYGGEVDKEIYALARGNRLYNVFLMDLSLGYVKNLPLSGTQKILEQGGATPDNGDLYYMLYKSRLYGMRDWSHELSEGKGEETLRTRRTRELQAFGLNINAQDSEGRTPLSRLVIEAEPGTLFRAVRNPDDQYNFVGILKSFGAREDIPDRHGKTARDYIMIKLDAHDQQAAAIIRKTICDAERPAEYANGKAKAIACPSPELVQ
jgi:hypothetical protein